MRSITLIAAIGAFLLLAVTLSAVPFQPNVGGYYSDQRTLFTNNIYSETGTTITLWGNYLPGAGTYALGSNSAPWNKVYSDTVIASYFSITGDTLRLNRLYTDTISPAATNVYMTGALWTFALDSTTSIGSSGTRAKDFYAKRAAINIVTTDTTRGILFRYTGNGYATDLTLTDSLSAVTGDFSGKLSVSTDASVGDSLYAARIYTPRLTASDSLKGVTGTFSGAVNAAAFTGAAADSAIRAQRADSSDLADSSRQAAHAYVADSATVASTAHLADSVIALPDTIDADSIQADAVRAGNVTATSKLAMPAGTVGTNEIKDYSIGSADIDTLAQPRVASLNIYNAGAALNVSTGGIGPADSGWHWLRGPTGSTMYLTPSKHGGISDAGYIIGADSIKSDSLVQSEVIIATSQYNVNANGSLSYKNATLTLAPSLATDTTRVGGLLLRIDGSQIWWRPTGAATVWAPFAAWDTTTIARADSMVKLVRSGIIATAGYYEAIAPGTWGLHPLAAIPIHADTLKIIVSPADTAAMFSQNAGRVLWRRAW